MQRRKDNKGRVLKDGESYRKNDGLYMYRWTDKLKKRHTIYASTLEELREKEEKITKDLLSGIKVGKNSVTVDDIYELWKSNKVGLKETTFGNYIYMYEHFIKGEFGNMKVQEVEKSDIRRLYNEFVNDISGTNGLINFDNIRIKNAKIEKEEIKKITDFAKGLR